MTGVIVAVMETVVFVAVEFSDVTMTTLPSNRLNSTPRTASAAITAITTVNLPRDFACEVELLFELMIFFHRI
jgi:hypothetical protein